MADIIRALSALTPLGLAGMLAYVIYLQVKNQRSVHTLGTNHLHDLPEMANDLKDIKALLHTMNDNVVYIRARVNGK